jgi:MFS family permease
MTLRVTSPKKGIFYGWFALSGVMLVAFVMGGALIYSYGVLLPVLCNEFGWNRGEVALGLTLGIMAFGLPSPLWGILVARFGPRVNMIIGHILAALGFAGMYLVQEIWHIYLLYILIGLGAGLGGYIANAAVASNWFVKKRSLAMGMFLGSSGVGGFIFPPFVTLLISAMGWRMSWLILAGIVFVVCSLISSYVLVRDRPEDMGQVPDGIYDESFEAAGNEEYLSETGGGQVSWRVGQALRLPATWLIVVFIVANGFALGAMNAHQVAYVQDVGYSAMIAATTMSLLSIFHIIGGLGFGTLALRFNIRYLTIAFFAVKLIALSILLTTKNLTLIYVYAALMGLSNGALITTLPVFVGEYYGQANYAQILGVLFTFQIVSQAVGPTIAGVIYDATTAYTMAFLLILILNLAGLICVYMLRKPKIPQPNDLL